MSIGLVVGIKFGIGVGIGFCIGIMAAKEIKAAYDNYTLMRNIKGFWSDIQQVWNDAAHRFERRVS